MTPGRRDALRLTAFGAALVAGLETGPASAADSPGARPGAPATPPRPGAIRKGTSPAARVIVVGGGFGGASCAHVLARLRPQWQITLYEPRRRFITGPMSNALIAGLIREPAVSPTPASLTRAGVDWRDRRVTAVDPVRRRVRDDAGQWHEAERLVIAPGIDLRWDRIEGLDADTSDAMPHGWLGDDSIRALRRRLASLGDGATVLIGAPPNPYRCPPGPYERASLFAWSLRARRAKILIADAKDDFSKRALFRAAWDEQHPGMIEWLPRARGGEVVGIDARRGEVRLAGGERVRPDLATIIPPQMAARLCHEADLTDETGWCPVDPRCFESTRHPGVYVIGDASIAQPVPKSAFAANSEAKLCALALIAALEGTPPPTARLINTCYSLIAPDQAISVSGLYGADTGVLSALAEGTSPLGGDAALRVREARDAADWYQTLLDDSFGSGALARSARQAVSRSAS